MSIEIIEGPVTDGPRRPEQMPLISRIEKGIPMPPAPAHGGRHASELTIRLKEMEVDDSITVSGIDGNRLAARLNNMRRNHGLEFSQRKLNEDWIRIWRVR